MNTTVLYLVSDNPFMLSGLSSALPVNWRSDLAINPISWTAFIAADFNRFSQDASACAVLDLHSNRLIIEFQHFPATCLHRILALKSGQIAVDYNLPKDAVVNFENLSIPVFQNLLANRFNLDLIKHPRITDREHQILSLIAQGLDNKRIASNLFISDQTVSVHRKNLMRKLQVSNAAGLVKKALDAQIIN